jgi:hypothetical protein
MSVIYVAYNKIPCSVSVIHLSRDGDLDFDTGLQANTRLQSVLDPEQKA